MSDSGGGNRPAYLVAAILTLTFVGMTLQNQMRENCGYHSAPQYECAPTDYGALALIIPTPMADPKPERNEWREEQDLYAQRQMAKWAFWMLVISGAGVVVGGLGLLFLKRTLDETRAMTEATREIGENQTRAYCIIKSAYVTTPQGMENQDKLIGLCVEVENTGPTPAVETAIKVDVLVEGGGEPDREYSLQFEFWMEGEPVTNKKTSEMTASIWKAEEITREFHRRLSAYELIPEGEEKPLMPAILILGQLVYRDVFSKAHKVDFTVWYPTYFRTYMQMPMTVRNDPAVEIDWWPKIARKELGSKRHH